MNERLLLARLSPRSGRAAPVWMMRQAGRYLPEYREVRERADFLTMVGTPELAVQVTLQPVDILGVDAAIIFSDILVVPQAMGMRLSVDEGSGPRFHDPLRTPAEFARLRALVPEEGLGYVLEAIRLARRELDGRVPLIGFAGAPWTLTSYMIEGRRSKSSPREAAAGGGPRAGARIARATREAVGAFLEAQVAAGAQVVQSSTPGPARWVRRTFASLPCRIWRGGAHRQGRGRAGHRVRTGRGLGPRGDRARSPAPTSRGGLADRGRRRRRRAAPFPVALQGNLDPCWLYASPTVIRQRTTPCWPPSAAGATSPIWVTGSCPTCPWRMPAVFVEAVKEWRA